MRMLAVGIGNFMEWFDFVIYGCTFFLQTLQVFRYFHRWLWLR